MRDEAKTKAQLISELRETRQRLARREAELTDHGSLAAALSQSRTQLNVVLQCVTDGVTVQDRTGRLLFANDAAARTTGYGSAQELLAAPLAEIIKKFSMLDADGQPFPLANLPGRLALAGVQEPPPTTVRFRVIETGAERWSVVNARPIRDPAGNVEMAVNIWHDITTHKQAELALAQQREYFAVTLASIGDGVIVTDLESRITFINPVAQQLTGWSYEQAVGHPLSSVFVIVNEATGLPVASPVNKVLSEGAVVGLANHTRLIRADGTSLPIDDSGAPIRNAANQIVGVVLVFRDISQRRQAEVILRESEVRFRTMADSAPVLIWMAETPTHHVYFNRTWLEFTGHSLDQELGAGWTSGLHPDDLPGYLEQSQVAFQARQPFRQEYRLRRADGVYRWILEIGQPLAQANGGFSGYIGSCVDINDHKIQEERQRFMIRAGEILTESLDYTTTLSNLAWLSVPQLADWCAVDMLNDAGSLERLAVAHRDPAKVEYVLELQRRYPPDPANPGGIFGVLASGLPALTPSISDQMLAVWAKDATHLELIRGLGLRSAMLVPLLVRGRAVGVITFVAAESGHSYTENDLALAQQIAQRAALAVDNAQLYREAQEALEKRDQFLSIATHELKTPVTSLLGYAQLLARRAAREGTTNDRDLRALHVIYEQAQRLNRLIVGVLDISRLQMGQLAINKSLIDLVELVRRVVDSIPPASDQHALELRVPDQQILVRGDDVRLEQVIYNLLQNAIRYSPEGGVVQVSMVYEDQIVRISVTDQGIGIPAAALPKLFTRFYRAENVETYNIGGMGIGLYVVKEIVQLHGGEIAVQSVEGQGSTFTISLPLADQTSR